MYGRYVSPDTRALEREWEIIHRSPLDDRWEEGLYNAAPTRPLPIVRMETCKSFVQPMRWGFIPRWWKQDARTETVVGKPMWREQARSLAKWITETQPRTRTRPAGAEGGDRG
jgi:putative SOS response-associated peptidase YedK